MVSAITRDQGWQKRMASGGSTRECPGVTDRVVPIAVVVKIHGLHTYMSQFYCVWT